ncbi:MAG: ferrous iron transport protein A [Chitinophagales bacterium]|nr:ferrous iron transport protein A [Chitinophagales bacterium]MDW8428638.1 FeoA family protein [Chitinophagales bacterium]
MKKRNQLISLAELKKGQRGIIQELPEGELSVKLMEMGLLPGETVRVEHVALWGDPISVKVGNSLLSLRKEEAQVVLVEP